MPTFDDQLPPIGEAKLQDRARHHEKATLIVDDIPERAALELQFHLAFGDAGIGGIKWAEERTQSCTMHRVNTTREPSADKRHTVILFLTLERCQPRVERPAGHRDHRFRPSRPIPTSPTRPSRATIAGPGRAAMAARGTGESR